MPASAWLSLTDLNIMKSNCVFLCAFSVGLVPTELGEKDGRNAGAAVTGLVNGKFIFFSCFHGMPFVKIQCVNFESAR